MNLPSPFILNIMIFDLLPVGCRCRCCCRSPYVQLFVSIYVESLYFFLCSSIMYMWNESEYNIDVECCCCCCCFNVCISLSVTIIKWNRYRYSFQIDEKRNEKKRKNNGKERKHEITIINHFHNIMCHTCVRSVLFAGNDAKF